ncbi:sensor domain-containing diguanylate cyclase [Anaerobranca gottschalkii]|uniref:Diguanylate cyclase (GGDEF) domain-containing protein n=1 Tax=Anaerobranca gottschalkii DSM 13577 TaxID=1120990 RepID=A0A1H9ZHX7_9FIRM|nr:sensor domain-containing diguanylate cyclase [Anaerobranca gottschalkii]SES81250.1 diguanylate cyclase (GGDEF) domain-containing protein [Anaerobranca gottschalkii DSM 13577]
MGKQKVFKGAVAGLGIILLSLGGISSRELFTSDNFGLILLFLVLSSLLERMTIPLAKGHLSLAFAFILCAFYVFQDLFLPVLIVSLGILLTQLIFDKRKVIDALFNVGIVSTSTIVGGYVFSISGGTWEAFDNYSIIPLFLMVFTIIVINHVILATFYHLLDRNYTVKILLHDIQWDLLTYFITVPLGIIMAGLYNYDPISIVIIFVPLVTSSYVFRLYKKVARLNEQLHGIYTITTEINASLDIEKTLSKVGEHCSQVLELNSLYIFLLEGDEELKAVYCKGDMKDYLEKTNLKLGQGATGYCAQSKQTVLVEDTAKDSRIFNNALDQSYSLLAVPMIRGENLIGVITGIKYKKKAFNKTEVLLLEILANQAAVALANAKTFKDMETKAIIDDLTKVYNYRYFQQRIQQEVEKAALEGSKVSLMVIDLDDFKRINDTYGHTVGNRVLIDLASIFRKYIRKYDVLFRYGGDEFVILFPDTDKVTAEKVAKRILKEVANTPLIIEEGIEEFLSFSAGIAEYPTDADDHLDLMRKADRTMYVGSKETGKNKVSVYNKRDLLN